MAKARKCDRCGKLYEGYNLKNDINNPNAIVCINLDEDNKYWSRVARDLCQDCIEEFKQWYTSLGVGLDGEPIKKENIEEEKEAK